MAGALGEDADRARTFGTDTSGVTALLRPFADDLTAPEHRALDDEEELSHIFRSLPSGGGSLDVLGRILADPDEELAQVFIRQKVTTALLERSRAIFVDP